MAKKAYLLTFHATTRIIVDSDKDPELDDELFSKCVAQARENMVGYGLEYYLDGDNAEIVPDDEMPYTEDYDGKDQPFFVKD